MMFASLRRPALPMLSALRFAGSASPPISHRERGPQRRAMRMEFGLKLPGRCLPVGQQVEVSRPIEEFTENRAVD